MFRRHEDSGDLLLNVNTSCFPLGSRIPDPGGAMLPERGALAGRQFIFDRGLVSPMIILLVAALLIPC